MTWGTELQEGRGICSGPQRREKDFTISSKGFQTYRGAVFQESVPVQFFILGVHMVPPAPPRRTPWAGSLSGARETQTQQNGP